MKLRTRISFQFLIQFIVLFITIFLIFIGLFVLIAFLLEKQEVKINPQKAIVENIPINTIISRDDTVKLNDKWVDLLKENSTWMQIINEKGEEIFSSNKPDSIQTSYSIHELLEIDKLDKHKDYIVDTYFETMNQESYYFLFGYVNNEQALIRDWYQTYSKEGVIDESLIAELEQKLEEHDGRLEVYEDDELIKTVGLEIDNQYNKLDIISRLHTPGMQSTGASVYIAKTFDTSWVFYPNSNEKAASNSGLLSSWEFKIAIISLSISLVIAITFSIWNGYRYGKPLLLFINWFEVIKNENYSDVFSEKEQKKIYRKNGKVKHSYRLYKEVIESFSNMINRLDEAEKDRKQLEETREDWMAGISHDLRTPLSSIHGYGHLLESNKYKFTSDELHEIGKVIREKSDYMVDLVDDFSLVFKLKNSTIEVDKSKVDLNEFIKTVLEKFPNDLTLAEYTFKFEPSDTVCYALIDSKWFIRALDNLIYNAVKHNPLQTTVTMKLRHNEDQIMIDITDNGVGMDEMSLNNLFSRYYRGISTDKQAEGEGLGMSITKAIIDLHDGDINVQSEKDIGTTITISLSK